MNKKELQAIAQAAAKNIKTEDDLNQFRQMLTKITVETALNAELEDHLGFGKGEQSDAGNNRNEYLPAPTHYSCERPLLMITDV